MAAIIGGTIKVNVTGGDLGGVYTGDFAYDDTHLTKVGSESMTINGRGSRTRSGLLSLNFRFLDFADGITPVTYTVRDVDGFPDYPLLYFLNGLPTQFGFQVDPGNDGGVWGGNNGFMFGDPGRFDFVLRNGASGGNGIVTLEINESPATAVPENASPLASLLAFLGLGGIHLWRKPKKANK
ncbi:hypothetical protein IQ269_15220 [Tychonema sp. LEGE 07199]|uniref:hypothetical protein n=1 Tax=unclassified Tychonema TaxID=2642144 RepID=UPI0018810E33|nr:MULTISPECIES: hypothetical protein [unclassified Tychonema]MBE9122122.1 hypothetical protein [Tychonema sp. LEGE 07199]MBE9131457.1 hypothetical protein [Tychonema sp. LEGE 07196]